MLKPQQEDLEQFLQSSRRELHRYCARLTGSVFEGEDVVQDVMVRALAAADTRPSGIPLRAWLFRIAHNRAVDVVRTRATRPRLASSFEEVDVPADTPFEAVARSEAKTYGGHPRGP